MAEPNLEMTKVLVGGPISTVLDRKTEILEMNYEAVGKLAKVLESVAWCGGAGCGHGAEAIRTRSSVEVMKVMAAGPIVSVLDRSKDILALNHEEVEKISTVLTGASAAWCGGFNCGHGHAAEVQTG